MLFQLFAIGITLPILCLSIKMTNVSKLNENRFFYDKQYLQTSISLKSKWMKDIDDRVPLDLVIIPGTHDSATYCIKILKEYAVTQSLTISQQLEVGIRYFDIRLCYSNDNPNALFICHGILSCKLTFDEVMQNIIKFIDANPNEGIILKVQNERKSHSKNIDRLLSNILFKYNKYILQTNTIPLIGQLRGKFLLMLSDITVTNYVYIEWLNIDLFAKQTDFVYKSKNEKKKKILSMDALIAQNTYQGMNPLSFYVNEFSANGLPGGNLLGTIKSIAKEMNQIVTEIEGRVGIVIFDYPSQELIDYLLNKYFVYYNQYYNKIIKSN